MTPNGLDTSYAPGVRKLLCHERNVKATEEGRAWPVTIGIAVTTRCQLACPFCAVKERPDGMSLSWEDFKTAIACGRPGWTQGVEFNGGEPGLWPDISKGIMWADCNGLSVGVVTNGALLSHVPHAVLDLCAWIRVSLNGFEEGQSIPDAWIRGRITGNFVWHIGASFRALEKAVEWCRRASTHLRLVVDALAPKREGLIENAREAAAMFDGMIRFDAGTAHGAATACLMLAWKPMVGWDGYVYPCCCEGTPERERTLPRRFRLCHVSEFKAWLERGSKDACFRCKNCYYQRQNAFLSAPREIHDAALTAFARGGDVVDDKEFV